PPRSPRFPYTTLFRSSTAHLTDAANGTVARSAVQARVDAVVWPMDGMLPAPTGFRELGSLSSPGPLPAVVAMIAGGAVLVLAGRSEEHTSELQSRENL